MDVADLRGHAVAEHRANTRDRREQLGVRLGFAKIAHAPVADRGRGRSSVATRVGADVIGGIAAKDSEVDAVESGGLVKAHERLGVVPVAARDVVGRPLPTSASDSVIGESQTPSQPLPHR